MSEIKTLKGKISCRQASEDTRVIIDNSFSIVVPKGMKFSTDQTEFEDNKIFALFSPVDPDSLLEKSVDFEYGASSARLRIDPKKRSLSSLNTTDKEVQKIMEAAFSDAAIRKQLEQALLSGLSNVAESFVVKNDENAIVVATTPMAIAFGNAAFAIMIPNGYTYSGQYLVRDDPEAVLDVASPAVYKKTIKKWLGTVEVVLPQQQKSAEQQKTAAESKPKSLTKGEITYKKGHVFTLASLAIPVPDGMRYMAHTATSSVPNGKSVPASKMNYDFVCYTGKAITNPDQYKDARFGFSVISPQVISASECADSETKLTQELAEGIATKIMEATYQQVNKKPQEILYDRKETNVIIAHSRLDKSTDKENYWESFLFVVVDSPNMICYRGTIFINAPSNRRSFDAVVKEFLQHISVLDGVEKSPAEAIHFEGEALVTEGNATKEKKAAGRARKKDPVSETSSSAARGTATEDEIRLENEKRLQEIQARKEQRREKWKELDKLDAQGRKLAKDVQTKFRTITQSYERRVNAQAKVLANGGYSSLWDPRIEEDVRVFDDIVNDYGTAAEFLIIESLAKLANMSSSLYGETVLSIIQAIETVIDDVSGTSIEIDQLGHVQKYSWHLDISSAKAQLRKTRSLAETSARTRKEEYDKLEKEEEECKEAIKYGVLLSDLSNHRGYLAAIEQMEKAKTPDEYLEAAAKLKKVKGYLDANERLKQCEAKASEIETKEREIETKERAEEDAYEKALSERKTKVRKEIKIQRSKEKQAHNEKLEEIERQYRVKRDELTESLQTIEQDLAQTQQALSQLGFFKMREKKELRERIEATQRGKDSVEAALSLADSDYGTQVGLAEIEFRDRVAEIQKSIQKKNPMPPVPPSVKEKLGKQRAEKAEQRRKKQEEFKMTHPNVSILQAMLDYDSPRTCTEIVYHCKAPLSKRVVSLCLKNLISEGYVMLTEEMGGRTYFNIPEWQKERAKQRIQQERREPGKYAVGYLSEESIRSEILYVLRSEVGKEFTCKEICDGTEHLRMVHEEIVRSLVNRLVSEGQVKSYKGTDGRTYFSCGEG